MELTSVQQTCGRPIFTRRIFERRLAAERTSVEQISGEQTCGGASLIAVNLRRADLRKAMLCEARLGGVEDDPMFRLWNELILRKGLSIVQKRSGSKRSAWIFSCR